MGPPHWDNMQRVPVDDPLASPTGNAPAKPPSLPPVPAAPPPSDPASIFLGRRVEPRAVVAEDSLEINLESAYSLADNGNWHACLQVCNRAALDAPAAELPLVQTCQVLAMMRLRLFSDAQRRVGTYLPNPADSFDTAPFGLQLASAELAFCLDPTDASSSIQSLRALCSHSATRAAECTAEVDEMVAADAWGKMAMDACVGPLVGNQDSQLWRRCHVRALNSLAGVLVASGQLSESANVLLSAIASYPECGAMVADACRVYIQQGNIKQAEAMVCKLQELAEEDAELFASAQLHDGLVHVALSNLDTAMDLLTKAATASGEGETFVQAETCRSVAAMQSGHLTQAISILENVLRTDPANHLHPSLLFNLCTMYDLDNAAEESEAKKGVLMALVKHYAADDFDTSNLPIKA